ncbi:MAG: alpha-amylase family glycosyl hydrolase [Actinomycetota bacterium]
MTNTDRDAARPWWLDEVLYQIYPRSFADTNGDGVGDIQGIIERLDYLEWLGIGGIWLNPVTPSPNADWGYDVADYCDVHPELGTLEDVDRLVKAATERGIRIVFDIVPNHTSDQHEWFKDALTGRKAEYRDYYLWADPAESGGPPNNWLSVFGGSAWEWHQPTGQYYLHNFLDAQPDLDWWNEEVRDEFDHILSFWFDRGIAGFRIDVAHALIKDRALRDNLPARDHDHDHLKQLGQRQIYNMNRPEVHDILKRWRKICDTYDPERILIGETFVYELTQWVEYYGTGSDELNLAFNFPFALGQLDPEQTKEVVRASEELIPPDAWPVWMMSNHDIGRGVTRMCHNDPELGRVLMMLVLTLRGTPFVYYGDEIGMTDTRLRRDQIRDPVGLRTFGEVTVGRDGCRTPMQWSAEPGAGFTAPGVEPWLPFGEHSAVNVEAQRDDPDSWLNFTRSLIQLRKESDDLRSGAYEELDSPIGTWVFRRGEGTVVALNMGDGIATIEEVEGTVRASTAGGRIDEHVPGRIDLQPRQGVVVAD